MGRRGETVSYTNTSFEETYSKKLDAIKVQLKGIIYGGLPFTVSQEYACKKCAGRIKLHADGRMYCMLCVLRPGAQAPNWPRATKERIVEIMAGYPDYEACYQEWEAKQIKPYIPPQEARMPKMPAEKQEIDQERMEFGRRLKEARKAKGLTIEQLASQIRKVNGASMSFSSVQMYESGATYPPDHILDQLVKILGNQILVKEVQEAIEV